MTRRTFDAETVQIEYPSVGATYSRQEYGVYGYGTYPRSSVLAGQPRRRWLGAYDTLEEAQRHWPHATIVEGTGYVPVSLNHLPNDEG